MLIKKPNLFVKPNSGFNNGIYPIETFQEDLKTKNNLYITNLLTTNNFLTKYNDEIFGYDLNVEKPNMKIVTNSRDMDFDNGTFIIYDLETTGLHAKYDHITEIGAIKVTMKDGKEVKREEFQRFVKQDQPLKPFISKLTHITDEMLDTQGVSEKEAIKDFKQFCGNCPCIGHNIIKFDSRFINKKCEEYGLSKNGLQFFDNAQIDTMEVSKLFNQRPNHTLRSMAQDLKITYDPKYQHRAIADVIVNWEVFKQTCIPAFKEHGIKNVKDINGLAINNIIYKNQHHATRAIIYPNPLAKLKLLKLAQENNLTFYNILKQRDNIIITNNPSSSEIFDSYVNDSPVDFEETISKYDFISLPPPSFWTNLLTTQTSSRLLDLNNSNDKLIYENREELKKIMINCTTDEQRMEALGSSPIFSKLHFTSQNIQSILSKIDYLTNPLCDIKKFNDIKKVEVIFKNDPALTLEQVQDAYSNIIKICKKNGKSVIIDNEILISSSSDIKDFNSYTENHPKSPYKKFSKTTGGCKIWKFTTEELKKELAFLNDSKLVDELIYKNPKKQFEKIKEMTKKKKLSILNKSI